MCLECFFLPLHCAAKLKQRDLASSGLEVESLDDEVENAEPRTGFWHTASFLEDLDEGVEEDF